VLRSAVQLIPTAPDFLLPSHELLISLPSAVSVGTKQREETPEELVRS